MFNNLEPFLDLANKPAKNMEEFCRQTPLLQFGEICDTLRRKCQKEGPQKLQELCEKLAEKKLIPYYILLFKAFNGSSDQKLFASSLTSVLISLIEFPKGISGKFSFMSLYEDIQTIRDDECRAELKTAYFRGIQEATLTMPPERLKIFSKLIKSNPHLRQDALHLLPDTSFRSSFESREKAHPLTTPATSESFATVEILAQYAATRRGKKLEDIGLIYA